MAKKLIAALTDSTLFLQEWFANPQRTGSLAPSSNAAWAAMANGCRPIRSYVLELGPGTGAVTDALIKRGLREDRLVAIERNPKMARLLRDKFPRAQIISGRRLASGSPVAQPAPSRLNASAVISSAAPEFPHAKPRAHAKNRAVLEPDGNWSIQLSPR